MPDPKPDVCRIMAENLWNTAKLSHTCSLDKEEWVAAITDAIRNHTAYPDCIGALEEALPVLHSDKRQRVVNALAKAGRK